MSRAETSADTKGKYAADWEEIRREIEGRLYAPGERLPSDAEMAKRFNTSRLTVIRAIRELETEGLVSRKAGAGTFVRGAAAPGSRIFGLLVPDLGSGEVFEPICQGIARAGESANQTLLWGDLAAFAERKEEEAEELCRYFIARKVSGVFFSPVELTPHQVEVNGRITANLDRAGIPIVLIDRDYCPYPERSRHDLVGVDNRRCGYRLTQHLTRCGAKRIGFAFRGGSAATVAARMAGWREATWNSGMPLLKPLLLGADVLAEEGIASWMAEQRPDGIVCANDLTATRLMHNLLKLGFRVPDDIAMVGMNDVKYAEFLPVPLTTLRQPCREIGAAALRVMLERLERPDLPARDVLLDCELIVRQSCGGDPATASASV